MTISLDIPRISCCPLRSITCVVEATLLSEVVFPTWASDQFPPIPRRRVFELRLFKHTLTLREFYKNALFGLEIQWPLLFVFHSPRLKTATESPFFPLYFIVSIEYFTKRWWDNQLPSQQQICQELVHFHQAPALLLNTFRMIPNDLDDSTRVWNLYQAIAGWRNRRY